MRQTTMIQLIDLCKSYGPLEVVSHVSLEIGEAEIIAIVGPSGAGKTTLLQIAGTLDRPDSGRIIYDGTDVMTMKDKKLSAFRNRNIGFIFQFHQLLPEFNACENVAIPAMIAGMSRKEAMAKADALLKELGLADRSTHKPGELSGGEKQRVAIARALVNNPRVVLADEPTGSLDSRNRDEIRSIISSLRDKFRQTFVIVTHDPTVASIADRTVAMADGKITGIIQASEPDSSTEIIEEVMEEDTENTVTEL